MNERFRIYTHDDVIGVELGGALKNVIAIAAGVCDGIGFGDNTKAALCTRGLAEMSRLGVGMGARPERKVELGEGARQEGRARRGQTTWLTEDRGLVRGDEEREGERVDRHEDVGGCAEPSEEERPCEARVVGERL